MKLPSFLAKISRPKEEKEYFLALEIKTREVKAAVWQKEKDKITLVNFGKGFYRDGWDEAIKAADEAIVEASGNIAQEELEKVIFGIPQEWTTENKIGSPHLANFKKLCTQLSLKPLGFVIIPEAIVTYFQQIEGVPPTALLIGLEEKSLTLTLVKAGRIEGTKVVEKKEGITFPEQIEQGLEGFSVEILPSRILLYDTDEDLEKLKRDLLSHRFSEKLPFLHLPKIEILDKDFDIRALALTSGAQMGEVITSQEISTQKSLQVTPEGEALGFVRDKDILEEEEEKGEGKIAAQEERGRIKATPPEVTKIEEGKPPLWPQAFSRPPLPNLKLPQLKIPQFDLPFLGRMKWLAIFFVLALTLAGGVLWAVWWYLPKAEVRIEVQAKPSGKEAEIIVSQDLAKSEEGSKYILGHGVEVEETASEKIPTTGKKAVGDPAKGKVIIYNKTENPKKFPTGSVLTGPDDLNFTLDEEVSVASTAAFSTSFSNVSGKVTAVKIGPEGNLPAETNFAFEDYPTSSYFAKSDGAFSGGTSREVFVVARVDQEKLLENLAVTLLEKAKKDLREKLAPGEKLLEEMLTPRVVEKKFDKEVGGEASELSLTLSTLFKALAYNEKDLKARLTEDLKETAPQGYELDEEETKIEILEIRTKEGEATLKVAAKANLLPKLNPEEIQKEIVGKRKSSAQDYLRGLGGVEKVDITTSFPLSLPLENLPFLPQIIPQNVKVEIVSTQEAF